MEVKWLAADHTNGAKSWHGAWHMLAVPVHAWRGAWSMFDALTYTVRNNLGHDAQCRFIMVSLR